MDESILEQVDDFSEFLYVAELDKKLYDLVDKDKIINIGKSADGHSILCARIGKGSKNALIFGFPHPNEPIGSLTCLTLIELIQQNKSLQEKYTWYIIPCADPDGARLNEGWFKGNLDFKKYFLHYYRPPASRQLDWTFPIKYKDFRWNQPMPETKVLMRLIDEVKPDLMYPLHNSGYGGAYFLLTQKFDDGYCNDIIKLTKELGIPLHLGEPEEEFMKEIKKPFYFDFTFKDYYEQEVKLGTDPKKTLKTGDNSTGYLLRINPSAIVIKGEIPYFFDNKIINTKLSDKTRREIWLEMLDKSDKKLEFYTSIVPGILERLNKQDPYYYLISNFQKRVNIGNEDMRKYVKSSSEFERKATYSEIFDCTVGFEFCKGLSLGQLRRAAIKARLNQKYISDLDKRINNCVIRIKESSNLKPFPIKKLVQLQLGCLLISWDYL